MQSEQTDQRKVRHHLLADGAESKGSAQSLSEKEAGLPQT